ncbi:MAG: UDP-N-acetylmuramoyl-L-alanyl-D-glutamate--2,6-diaminopimelate ligase [Anaerolineaceae bacterium]|nr:UDP-N-acetylmuramoyl-L-alanyl-D-glutamate--2,6-diaminopimelate ligase [Anaerolineaceae bacterium]
MEDAYPLKAIAEYYNLIPQNGVSLEGLTVTELISDSRDIKPGCVFFAWKGGSFDSHKFIPDAISRGAIAVVGTETFQEELTVPYFIVENSRYMLAGFAAYINEFPANKMTIIGVTGTDGKTTTTNYIYHILQAAGIKAGMISTVNAVIGDETIDTGFHVTTPEAPQVQKYLKNMLDAGVTHVVLETTSHGLAQHRVAFCAFDYAVVTNITHEHLDYHGSYEVYLASKALLFQYVAQPKKKNKKQKQFAVLNKSDRSFACLSDITQDIQQITYDLQHDADIWADEIINTDSGIDFQIHLSDECYAFHTNLKGEFNVLNCLAAIALAYNGLDISIKTVQKGIDQVKSLVGRMDEISMGQSFRAFVDFAHTPFGLEAALKSARKLTNKRVIAVFGSAGLRDKLKRRMMSQISADLADITILTAEDPRIESLKGILLEMSDAMNEKNKKPDKDYFIEPDRGNALRYAVKMAQPGDLIIACGKGHEQSMCFGEIEYAWDEKTALSAALAEHLGLSAPEMPYLPTIEKSYDS